MKPAQTALSHSNEAPFPSALELVLHRYRGLVDVRRAHPLALQAAIKAMAPATRAAIVADLNATCTGAAPGAQPSRRSPLSICVSRALLLQELHG